MKPHKLLFIIILTAFVFLLQSCVGLGQRVISKDYNARWADDNNIIDITLYRGGDASGKGILCTNNNAYEIYVLFIPTRSSIILSLLNESTSSSVIDDGNILFYSGVKNRFLSRRIYDQNKIRIYGNIKLSESINYDIDLILNCYKIEDSELDAKNYLNCFFSSDNELLFYTAGFDIENNILKDKYLLSCYYTSSYYGKNTTNNTFIKVYFLDNRHILFNEIKNDYTEEILFSGIYTTSLKTMTVTLDTDYTFNNSDINIVFDIVPYSQDFLYE
ncbi:MAG: hypothetical protein LBV51_05380 [Acholeplasmatales bacterium]|jgi:hypothetical protein|nr:hypothetical protein [Acholeplasmatales bacterium]